MYSMFMMKFRTTHWLLKVCLCLSCVYGVNGGSYHPLRCPDEFTDEPLCSCPTTKLENSELSSQNANSCSEEMLSFSHETYEWISNTTSNWREGNTCDRSEEAFRKSILAPDKRNMMKQFLDKVQACENEEIDTVSVVVFGGSVTLGTECHQAKQANIPETDFLGFPSVMHIPIVRGDERCPWSNRLYTLLKNKYPKCQHVDVYNLAYGSTTHAYALEHLSEYMNKENSTRDGKSKLGDVVDLVLVDYGVNEGMVFPDSLNVLGLNHTEISFVARVEALSEYFIHYVISKIPSRPALMHIAAAPGDNNKMMSLLSYLDACQRFGTPLVSFKHVASYPDNACWLAFKERGSSKYRRFNMEIKESDVNETNAEYGIATTLNNGFFHDIDRYSSSGVYDPSISDRIPLEYSLDADGNHMKNTYGRIPLKEGPTPTTKGHHFQACWGLPIHPKEVTHALFAKLVFYSIHMLGKASETVLDGCAWSDDKSGFEKKQNSIVDMSQELMKKKKKKRSESENMKEHFYTHASENALKLNKLLNPYSQCPFGPLVEYDSEELYSDKVELSELSINNINSKWQLKSDRPHKFGFIIEESSRVMNADSLDVNQATKPDGSITYEDHMNNSNDGEALFFDVKLSHIPQITIEYMHSYENSGKIIISLEQPSNREIQSETSESSESTSGSVESISGSLKADLSQTFIQDRSHEKKIVAIPSDKIPQLQPSTALVLDSYRPEVRYALYAQFIFDPVGFEEGEAVLVIRRYSESLSDGEFLKRGGDRFKLVSISSC